MGLRQTLLTRTSTTRSKNFYLKNHLQCSLCLTEKVSIARDMSGEMLNKRSEIMNRCRHKDKHYLTNFLTSHNPPVQYQPAQLPSQPDHPPDQQHTLPDLEPIQQDNAQHVHPPDQLLNVHDPEPVTQHIAQLPSHHINPPDQ